jgi:outer membrane protein TolC
MANSFRSARYFAFAVLCVTLAACASYTALPLAQAPALASRLDALRHDGVALDQPLTIGAISLLTVQNDPDLLATRAQHDLAQAQVLQAGLLPNPQINGAILPLLAGVGSTVAFNAGFSEDLKVVITLKSRRAAADAAARQVDASLLWAEWQAIGQAWLLAVDIMAGVQSLRLLQQAFDLLTERSRRTQLALRAGNTTLAALAPDLAATQSARAALNDLQRLHLQRRHQLNALLGLAPDVTLVLAEQPDLGPAEPAAVLAALPSIAQRRPDLVALQMGYAAQDQKMRTAILSQFPNLIFGVTGGSDNSNVRNIGPQISTELPIFDRNQGNIAIERATRQQLHDEYTARLTAADGQVRAMLAEMAVQDRQLAAVRQDLPGLRTSAAHAEQAFRAGTIDDRAYVDLVSARTTKEQEIVTLRQAQNEQRVAIATLIGAGMPPIALPETAP